MGLLRGGAACARAMARLGALRSHYCALLLAAALAVCAFYYLGSGRETFSSATKRLKEARAGAAAPTPPAPELARGSAAPASGAKAKSLEGGVVVPVDYHLLMMFTKAEHNAPLQAKARVALSSLLRLAKFEAHEVLNLHFVSEEASREVAKALLRELLPPAAGFKCKVIFHDVAVLTDKLFPVVEAMQKYFSAGSGTYYSDSIFFLSVAMHQIMPKEIPRIIQLDLDLKYKTNIRELFEEFDNFLPGAVIGIAREMQPVYRHTFWQFRHENPKTRVGDPPPEGLPGFNSGVMLLNLEAMRQSPLYSHLLEPSWVQQLADKYHFRGHLGDQDFFTMIGMEHPELFHVLDCTWNRQLCTWWRDHGYSDVFQAYFRCEGHVKIYHGNCNTPIPED
ncbi:xyloside xylosyltransferase 1 [Mus musculus]|uniref:Xyloside xylosyltransferase 1 n=3 Tax=Mus musculus TaxID=10090 RepID=XXLT1_MOUSE|nr:xyloside xylosyltransferase 1 [Mus musculus]Q3U4G3.2 RecName: Full=Xyloside xylosyltransferase 1; AltName: Full=UDP-xylose:alpha-xyloside alpha-1,3-xylosyltransferase [Mus musculus]|eukprot:NP_941028.2 xyloside xylosyltransferase 1 [Mus musculus]